VSYFIATQEIKVLQ